MNATMTYGPFSLGGATAAGVNFWFDLTSEPNYDWFYAGASGDGVNWIYDGFSGDGWGGWRNDYPFDLTPWLGDSSVWFRFRFTSDGSVTYPGVFVDDVEIWSTGGTPTPTPTPPPDQDGDTIPDALDNCPSIANADQADGDSDGVGNVCDNCPSVSNSDQAKHDSDPYGDACDPDDDNDGFVDTKETTAGSDSLNVKCYKDNAVDDDSDGKVNDGCPMMSGASETGTQCANATDDDGDTWVNDGCPQVGTKSESNTPELCDGVDNDGDTVVDEGYPDTNPGGPKDCLDPLVDTDHDGTVNTADTNDDNDGWTDADENWIGADSLDACPENTSDDAWPPDVQNDGEVNVKDIVKFMPVIMSRLGGTDPNDYNYDRRYDLYVNARINIQDVLKLRPYILLTCSQ